MLDRPTGYSAWYRLHSFSKSNPSKDLKMSWPKVTAIVIKNDDSKIISSFFDRKLPGIECILLDPDAQLYCQTGRDSNDEIHRNLISGQMVCILFEADKTTKISAAVKIAKTCRALNILAIAVVLLPCVSQDEAFQAGAERGLEKIAAVSDTVIPIFSSDFLKSLSKLSDIDAVYQNHDEMIRLAVKGVTDVFLNPGYFDIEFDDVREMLKNSGMAFIAAGFADIDLEATKAMARALRHPLMNSIFTSGIKRFIMTISSKGNNISLGEMAEASDMITSAMDEDTEYIWGHCHDPGLGRMIRITLIVFPEKKLTHLTKHHIIEKCR
jgi:cell division protein FtsZ